MPPEKESVKSDESLKSKEDSSLSQKGDGTALKDPEKQSWENQAREWQRKYSDLSEKHEAVASEIAEIKERLADGEGTRGDRDRLSRLESKKEMLEEEKETIRTNPKARPWLSLTEDISTKITQKVTNDALYQYDYRQALKMATQTAKALKIEPKEFQDALFNILKGGRWEFDDKGDRIMPTDRVEMAIEEWHSMNDLKKKAEKKDEPQYSERGGRKMERTQSRLDEIKDAKESGNFRDILSKKAAAQQEHFK